MTKYAVFVGKDINNSMLKPFNQLMGYLDCLFDQEILRPAAPFQELIWKSADIERKFPNDTKIKAVLDTMDIMVRSAPDYRVIRVEVIDEDRLKEVAPTICKRYRLDYKIYEI